MIKGQNLVGDELIKIFNISQSLQLMLNNMTISQDIKEFVEENINLKSSNLKKNKNLIKSTDLYYIENKQKNIDIFLKLNLIICSINDNIKRIFLFTVNFLMLKLYKKI